MKKIDAHNHPEWLGYNLERYLENMELNGIEKTWLLSWECPENDFPPANLDVCVAGLSGDDSGPIPFSLCMLYAQRAPEKFVLGYAPDPRRPDAVRRLKSAVKHYNVKVCGELKIRMIYDNHDALELFRFCGENQLPVIFHLQYPGKTLEYWNNRREWYGGDMDTVEAMLKKCPDTIFLGHAQAFWANISKDDRGLSTEYPQGEVVRGGRLECLLRKYDNLYCDCSAGSCHNALSRDPDYTRDFVLEFQDRLLYARDQFDSIHAGLFESMGLPEDVLKKVFYQNAEKLIGA